MALVQGTSRPNHMFAEHRALLQGTSNAEPSALLQTILRALPQGSYTVAFLQSTSQKWLFFQVHWLDI